MAHKRTQINKTGAPFRYDIVGSFLRPERLHKARADFDNGILSKEELTRVEDEEITKLIQKQKSAGLKSITDGEYRRSWWNLDFFWGLDGVEKKQPKSGDKYYGITLEEGCCGKFNPCRAMSAETIQLTGNIGAKNHPFLQHFRFTQQFAEDGIGARQTMPAPAQFLQELESEGNIENTKLYYEDIEVLFQDIAKTYNDFIAQLYTLGCRSIQLDDCTWSRLCNPARREAFQNKGIDFKDIAQRNARLNNFVIQSVPNDMVVTTHVCLGNYCQQWKYKGGYEPIAEIFLGQETVDGFYLEFDTTLPVDFRPLRFVKQQKVALGLISTKTGKLENKQQIIDFIREASNYIDLQQLCLSPQCGFACTEEGNDLTEEEQWQKIALIKEIAEEIWC